MFLVDNFRKFHKKIAKREHLALYNHTKYKKVAVEIDKGIIINTSIDKWVISHSHPSSILKSFNFFISAPSVPDCDWLISKRAERSICVRVTGTNGGNNV